jgi:hypothetical protein
MSRLDQIKKVNELLLEDQPQYQKDAETFPQDPAGRYHQTRC